MVGKLIAEVDYIETGSEEFDTGHCSEDRADIC
jgi:hypothetical protein